MIIQLKPGDQIVATRLINPIMVSNWKHSNECASIGSGLMPGTRLEVMAVCKTAGAEWVEARLPGSDPPRSLKIAGGDFSGNFRRLA